MTHKTDSSFSFNRTPRLRIRSAWLQALASTIVIACVAIASSARAQELNRKGNLVFGAERLFGFYLDKQNYDGPGAIEGSNDTTVVGIGWSLLDPSAILAIPRFSVDYFLDEHLTLGGSFGIAAVNTDGGDVLGLLFAARVGYALRITNAVSFWPRGGLTVATVGDNNDVTVFGLTIEGMFTLAPSDGWAFLAGPLLDLGLFGSGPVDDQDRSEILFGIMFGISGWLEV
jgi:hypothetical protein